MGAYTALILQVVALVTLCASAPSPSPGGCAESEFWSAEAGRCEPCTRCAGPGREVTLRPCEGHRDALCGSLRDLRIDWASLSAPHPLRLPQGWQEELSKHTAHQDAVQDSGKLVFDDDYILPDELSPPKHHSSKQKKNKHRFRKPPPPHAIEDDDDYADAGSGSDRDEPPVDEQPALPRTRSSSSTTSTPPPSLVEDLVVLRGPEDAAVEPADGDVSMRAAFTPVERLVWDWQAGVLVAAVCACVLFFVVAAVYAYQHVWHFKVLKKRINADMEEISARFALMSGMGHEHFQEPSTPPLGHHARTGRQHMNEYSVPRKSKV